eukprot:TRINITY_DN60070_c0_g1_i1.p1 TRINITY_DN60070_c0_g1~~TRINITY_DN60070_c0_g1_i1.p1  ORF type:complete len:434 (+),score=62.02 TRINITY_DN60070_c0_g1_i1:121-1302(+)
MDAEAAKMLAQQSLATLRSKGVTAMQSVESADARLIQGVWTGAGGITEVTVRSDSDAAACEFVAKSIGSYRKVRDDFGLQDHWSYYNELIFYESELPDRIFAAGALCPRPLFVSRKSGDAESSARKFLKLSDSPTMSRIQKKLRHYRVIAEDGSDQQDEGVICMTKLAGGRWRANLEGTHAALSWLARLHALFWGKARTDSAIGAGVSDQACFWHFDNRQLELNRMSPDSRLRLAASGIDARLKADAMQTMCHGDPKGANIMWDEDEGLSMYDFQWFGKAPPTKDLAYFFATAALNGRGWKQDKEEAFLRHYHGVLSGLLASQGDSPPTFEYLFSSYRLAVVDYGRWIEGAFCWGNMDLIQGHTAELWRALGDCSTLKSEADYRERMFACFPP